MGVVEGKRPASRSWAMLLARIYENRPLQYPRFGQAMTILAFILDQEVIERILHHVGEETTPPRALPARSPPQLEMPFAQTTGPVTSDEMYQTTEKKRPFPRRPAPVSARQPARSGRVPLPPPRRAQGSRGRIEKRPGQRPEPRGGEVPRISYPHPHPPGFSEGLRRQPGDSAPLLRLTVLLAVLMASVALASDFAATPSPKPISGSAAPPPDPALLRQGGDTIATATVIPQLPYDDSGTTTGFTDDYAGTCLSDDGAPDVVYALTVPDAVVAIDVSLCGSSFDTGLYVYDSNFAQIACNDESCGSQSQCDEVPVTSGETYYIVVDGWASAHGNYVLSVRDHPPCQLEVPPAGFPEGEPPLANDHDDLYNGGCNTPGLPMQVLYGDANGELVFCGRAGFYLYGSYNYRDTDWFSLPVGDAGVIEVLGDAERLTMLMDRGPHDCGTPEWTQDVVAGACSDASMVMLGTPGSSMWFVVLPMTFSSPTGDYPYEYDYVVHFAGLQASVTTECTSWSTIKALFE
jgi:hypothetical protein